MTVYIGFLRGINVGGNKKISMAELKRMLETMGLGRVQTVLQTGNMLFESGEEAETLRLLIQREIQAVFGLSVAVMLRTATELARIIRDCPFAPDALSAGETIQISVLSEPISQKSAELLANVDSGDDEFRICGTEIYFLFRQSILDSPLGKQLQKLGSTTTTRNWNTIVKLDALAKKLEA